ncbi:MAG TPA: FCD domain-containing protein [Candidatus Competibacteraceae bacterium]|nr:FCD domain-containing protein [Candidatus Competibacteraceae bacterium]
MKPVKIPDMVVHQLEATILEGIFKPGDRLPPERELSERFHVSRPSLREAIKKLEARGLVQTRRGGGTYVTRLLDTSFTQPLAELFQSHPETLWDLLEMRQALEGVAAYYAALRRTEADLEILTRRFEAMNAVYAQKQGALVESKVDAEFHLAIAEAAHNVVLLHIMRGLFDLLHSGIRTSLELMHTRIGAQDPIHDHHRGLLEAVRAGDAERAREMAYAHISYIRGTLEDIEAEKRRCERSQRRLQGLGD